MHFSFVELRNEVRADFLSFDSNILAINRKYIKTNTTVHKSE